MMEVTGIAKNCYWCGIYGDVRPAWRDDGDHGTILDLCSTCRDRDVPPEWKKCRDYPSGYDPQLYPKAARNRQTPPSSAASELVMRKARAFGVGYPPEYWDPPIYLAYQIAALRGRNPIAFDIAQVSHYGGRMVEYKHKCLQQRRKDAVAFHAGWGSSFPPRDNHERPERRRDPLAGGGKQLQDQGAPESTAQSSQAGGKALTSCDEGEPSSGSCDVCGYGDAPTPTVQGDVEAAIFDRLADAQRRQRKAPVEPGSSSGRASAAPVEPDSSSGRASAAPVEPDSSSRRVPYKPRKFLLTDSMCGKAIEAGVSESLYQKANSCDGGSLTVKGENRKTMAMGCPCAQQHVTQESGPTRSPHHRHASHMEYAPNGVLHTEKTSKLSQVHNTCTSLLPYSENPPKSIGDLFKIDRTSIENLSKIYRPSIRRKLIEHL